MEIETRKALCTSQSDAWRYSFRGTNLHRQVRRGISSCDAAKSITIKLKLMESMSPAFSILSSCRRSLNAATVNKVSTKFQNLTVSKYCSLVASDSEWAAKHRNLTLNPTSMSSGRQRPRGSLFRFQLGCSLAAPPAK